MGDNTTTKLCNTPRTFGDGVDPFDFMRWEEESEPQNRRGRSFTVKRMRFAFTDETMVQNANSSFQLFGLVRSLTRTHSESWLPILSNSVCGVRVRVFARASTIIFLVSWPCAQTP